MFKALDKDQSGIITKDEFDLILTGMTCIGQQIDRNTRKSSTFFERYCRLFKDETATQALEKQKAAKSRLVMVLRKCKAQNQQDDKNK